METKLPLISFSDKRPNRTLVKSKIVLENNGTGLVTYMWKKTWWIFGYWYPFGSSSCAGGINKEKIGT